MRWWHEQMQETNQEVMAVIQMRDGYGSRGVAKRLDWVIF